MDNMMLHGIFRVKQIKSKSSAEFFKDLEVGDTIFMRMDIRNNIWSKPTVAIYNTNGLSVKRTLQQLYNILQKFELEELF